MTKNIKILLFLSLLCCCHFSLPSQNRKIDSLLKLVKSDKEDRKKAVHLLKLADIYSEQDLARAVFFATQAKNIAEKIGDKKLLSRALGELGWDNFLLDNYSESIEFYNRALKIDEELNDKNGIAKQLGSIGIIYWNRGDFPKALDFYLKALKLVEELGNKNNIASNLANIGIVYYSQGDYSKALEYNFKALSMHNAEDKRGIGSRFSNIGNIYYSQGHYTKALDYHLRSLKIDEELGDKIGVATALGNLGNVFSSLGDSALAAGNTKFAINDRYPKALNYYMRALKINEELGNKSGIGIQLGNIGSLNIVLGKYNEAYLDLYRCLSIDNEIGVLDYLKDDYQYLSNLYEKSNIPLKDTVNGKILNMEQMRLRSLHYYKRYLAIRDTLYSEENKKQLVRKEMNFEFEKKESAVKAEQDKKDVLAKEELKQKEQQRNYFITGFLLVGLLSVFIFKGYKQKQNANIIITEQKKLVDVKQKEILDSIHYARRIQRALLPSEKYFGRTLARLSKNK